MKPLTIKGLEHFSIFHDFCGLSVSCKKVALSSKTVLLINLYHFFERNYHVQKEPPSVQ